MNDNNLVSIIVPVYNVENFICATIESLINQTYKNIELILVDDGSTDNSLNIIKKYASADNRIVCIHQENGGAARARNAGLEQANGDYIMFVDGDDMITSNTIEDNLPLLLQNPTADWVAFSIIRVNENGVPIHHGKIYGNILYDTIEVVSCNDFVPYFQSRKLSGVCCGALYRTSSINHIKFPEDEFYEDGFFFIDLVSSSKQCIISDKGKYLYVHREGSSQLKALDYQHLLSDLKCATKRLRQYRERYPQHEDIYKLWENNLYYFYKKEMAKSTEGAKEIYFRFKKTMTYSPQINLKAELKYVIYRIFGYRNLKRLYNYFK